MQLDPSYLARLGSTKGRSREKQPSKFGRLHYFAESCRHESIDDKSAPQFSSLLEMRHATMAARFHRHRQPVRSRPGSAYQVQQGGPAAFHQQREQPSHTRQKLSAELPPPPQQQDRSTTRWSAGRIPQRGDFRPRDQLFGGCVPFACSGANRALARVSSNDGQSGSTPVPRSREDLINICLRV